MKNRTFMRPLALLLIAGLTGCSESLPLREPDEASQPATDVTLAAEQMKVGETTRAIAYYFHGTVRCETCLNIEKRAREVIQNRFTTEFASERLLFRPVNFDHVENAHFKKDYDLPCPSLVLVRQDNGKDQEWRLLGKTWEFVEVPPRLDWYIEEETRRFLDGLK